MERHKEMFLSLDKTGRQLVSGLTSQEDASLLHRQQKQRSHQSKAISSENLGSQHEELFFCTSIFTNQPTPLSSVGKNGGKVSPMYVYKYEPVSVSDPDPCLQDPNSTRYAFLICATNVAQVCCVASTFLLLLKQNARFVAHIPKQIQRIFCIGTRHIYT